ncbi:MAG TPA: hypothetical protein PLV72_00745 [Candidatus Magasanikbacteria bacterium]|nr:hypothetical protein [Candidatus Magasanikbacteria bacterium]
MLIAIPLYVFLFAYFVFLAIFIFFAIMNIYHILVTASFTFTSFLVTFLILAATIIVFYFTWYLTRNTDWQATATVFNTDWFSASSNYNF